MALLALLRFLLPIFECILPPDCLFPQVSHCSEEDNACVCIVWVRRSTTAINTACPSRGGGGRVSDRRRINLNLITQLLSSKALLHCVGVPAWYVLHSNRTALLFLGLDKDEMWINVFFKITFLQIHVN